MSLPSCHSIPYHISIRFVCPARPGSISLHSLWLFLSSFVSLPTLSILLITRFAKAYKHRLDHSSFFFLHTTLLFPPVYFFNTFHYIHSIDFFISLLLYFVVSSPSSREQSETPPHEQPRLSPVSIPVPAAMPASSHFVTRLKKKSSLLSLSFFVYRGRGNFSKKKKKEHGHYSSISYNYRRGPETRVSG